MRRANIGANDRHRPRRQRPHALYARGDRRGQGRGALTLGVANNRGSALLRTADLGILIETGEEVVAAARPG
jgi:N-acetylmuramic acid 6-phosphate etherase